MRSDSISSWIPSPPPKSNSASLSRKPRHGVRSSSPVEAKTEAATTKTEELSAKCPAIVDEERRLTGDLSAAQLSSSPSIAPHVSIGESGVKVILPNKESPPFAEGRSHCSGSISASLRKELRKAGTYGESKGFSSPTKTSTILLCNKQQLPFRPDLDKKQQENIVNAEKKLRREKRLLIEAEAAGFAPLAAEESDGGQLGLASGRYPPQDLRWKVKHLVVTCFQYHHKTTDQQQEGTTRRITRETTDEEPPPGTRAFTRQILEDIDTIFDTCMTDLEAFETPERGATAAFNSTSRQLREMYIWKKLRND